MDQRIEEELQKLRLRIEVLEAQMRAIEARREDDETYRMEQNERRSG